MYCLHSDTGGPITGSLVSAFRWESHYDSHRQGWFEIQFIHKVRHTVHDAEYDELLWIASNKLSDTFVLISISLCQSVDSLWQCWCMPKHALGGQIRQLDGEHSHEYCNERDSPSPRIARWLSESQVVHSTVGLIYISSEKGYIGIVYTPEHVRPCTEIGSCS